MNILSGTVTLSLARLISSLSVRVGDGGWRGPIFGVWVALVFPLQQGSQSKVVRWPDDPNGDTIKEWSFGGGGWEKVDIRRRLFRASLLFANDASFSNDRLSTCTNDCTPSQRSWESRRIRSCNSLGIECERRSRFPSWLLREEH